MAVRTVLIAAALAVCLASCRQSVPDRVEAEDYDAFWLWAGVDPQPALKHARTIYLLEGEVVGEPARYVSLRPQPPRLSHQDVWLVVRVETLRWTDSTYALLERKLDQWAAGNRLVGVQIDFDARTRHLDQYADFLTDLRKRLPRRYRLSITGLLDWSAHGDPKALEQLRPIVDEVVLQTYQARDTIPGYDLYFERLKRFQLPFRVGLVQGSSWHEPADLAANPDFRGYVVFLLNPRSAEERGRKLPH